MSFLSTFYNKAKKKLYDTFKPVEQKVSSGLGSAYNNTKNYFNNDATAGGIMKNTFNPSNLYESAGKLFDNPAKTFSDSMEQFDYFKPVANKVRKRDFIRELPGTTMDTAKSMFKGTYNLASKAPKIFGEGLAYATDKNVREQYKKGNLDIMPTVSNTSPKQMLADTGRSMLEVATAGKAPKVLNWMSNASKIKRAAAGAGVGYGFDVLGKIADEDKVDLKPGLATVAGGVFALGAPPLAKGMQKEAENVVKDFKNLKNPYTKRVVTKMDYTPVPDVYVGPNGENAMRPVIGSERKVVETIKEPFQPKSFTGKLLNARPGMNIEDVNMQKPRVISDSVIAQKNARAKELVGKQIDNQKAGLPVAEPGFVPPQNVPVPKPKSISTILKNQPHDTYKIAGNPADDDALLQKAIDDQLPKDKAKLPSIDEFVNGKKEDVPFRGDEFAKEIEPVKKTIIDKIKPEWRADYTMVQDDMKKIIREEADYMLSLKGQVGEVGIYKKIGEGNVGGDTGLRRFTSNPEWYRDFFEKNGRAPRKWEIEKIAESNLKNGKGMFVDEYNNLQKTRFEIEKSSLQSTPEFNKFQQRAYERKGERLNDIGEIMNYPKDLRGGGYRKPEIERMSIDEAKKKAKLLRLGYPKNEIQKFDFDRMDLIIKRQVPWTTLKSYHQKKNALNTNYLEGVDPRDIADINPLMAGGRDVYRNFEKTFGRNYPKMKSRLLDPFDEAKGNMIKEQEFLANEVFENIVKKFGIKKGSALDKAVVEFGEGKISAEQLQRDFPNDWKKVVDADAWFRNKYPELLDDLNAVREANFPTHPLYPENTKIIPKRKDYYRHGKDLEGIAGVKNMFETSSSIDPSLAATSDVTNPKTKWLSFAQKRKGDENDFGAVEGYLDYIKNHAYAKHIDPFIQKFKGVDDEARDLIPNAQKFEAPRIGLSEELAQKMDPVQQIADSEDISEIKNILTDHGVSEKQSEWMSKDLAGVKDYEKIKNFIKSKTAKNKEDVLGKMAPKAAAEGSENKLNNFLVFVKNFSRDLAGKTNPIDRPFQENIFGRKALKIISWANSRFKANAVLGNASSSLAQFFNIPQGFASAGIRNSTKGLGKSLAGIFKENAPIKQSAFIRERYFNAFNKFDEGILNNTKKFAVWMTGFGDKIGTEFIWNSHYAKAISEGIANPVKYADDWTRKMVAGRGIGEVPIVQKSKITQIVAPFQLEVANQWFALRDLAKNDPRKLVMAKKLIEFSIASYLMNRVVKEIRGSDVSFDPVNAMVESYGEYQDEENKGKGILKAGGRIAGEFFSNIPGGQTAASMYPESGFGLNKEEWPTISKYTNIPRKELFGEGDPTRFGTGGLPAFSAIKNPLTGFVLPYGGKQVEKMYQGGKTLLKGYAENASGKVMTPIKRDITNVMQGVLFGKNALGEVRDYYDNKQTPLSDLQTEKYKLMGNDSNYFNSVSADRASTKEKEALKIGKTPGETQNLSDDMSQLSNGNIYVKALDKEFKTEKLASIAIATDDLTNSDQNFMDLGDIVLRKGEDGLVHPMRKTSFTASILQQQMESQKRNEDLKGWFDTATKKLNLMNEMMNDSSIDELDKMTIQNDIDVLQASYLKYKGYGGFLKGKKAAKLEEKFRYPLVDPEFMKINMLISGLSGRKMRIGKKALLTMRRKPTKVHRKRRR